MAEFEDELYFDEDETEYLLNRKCTYCRKNHPDEGSFMCAECRRKLTERDKKPPTQK